MDYKKRNMILTILVIIELLALGLYNYEISLQISKIMDIQYDMALSVISCGFAMNLTILLTAVEVGLLDYVIYRVCKITKKIKKHIIKLPKIHYRK